MPNLILKCESRLRPGYGEAYRKLRDLISPGNDANFEIEAGRLTISLTRLSSEQYYEIEAALVEFLCEYSTKAGGVLQIGPSERDFQAVGKTNESVRDVWREYCKEQMFFWERKFLEIDQVRQVE